MKGYCHLTEAERSVIGRLVQAGAPLARIAQALGRHRSTIGRELARNRQKVQYQAQQAHLQACQRRSRASARPRIAPWVWQAVHALLCLVQAGPKQLAAILPVSHEAIYRWVYAQIAAGKTYLAAYLRSRRATRLAFRVRRALSALRTRPGIDARPAQVALRQQLGHWEIDLLGAASHHGAAILTMVERATNLTLVRRVWAKDAKTVGAAIVRALKPLAGWVKTITTDNGSEFACWRHLQTALGCSVYASAPGKPAQRAIVEHANGLIRQYLPKGKDAARLSAAALKRMQFALHHRPIVRLLGDSPYQAFYHATGVALQY
jgi:transposase, IS30 family